MAQFPALPLFTDAFIADTTHLSASQTGAYLMLLIVAWRTKDCRLPDDDRLLSRYARMDLRTWKANRDVILSFWKQDDMGNWYQARLLDERKYVGDISNKNANAGKISALKRKERHSTSVPTKRQQNVNPHTPPIIEDTNVSSPPTPKPKISYDDDFEDFWKGWVPYDMNKGSKEQAKKVYEKSRKEVTHEIIIGKRDQYLAECHRHQRRTTHASTWLNPTGNRGWADEYTEQSVGDTTSTELSINLGKSKDDRLRDRVNATARQIDDLLG